MDDERNKRLDKLYRLSLKERYILLLFCWQRFSLKRIAKIISLPMFITKKRLYAALNKAANSLEVWVSQPFKYKSKINNSYVKGKPGESRGRKAKGLRRLKRYDSLVAKCCMRKPALFRAGFCAV